MKIKEFIELSNQEIVNYLKERLSQFTEPTDGREEVYNAINLDQNSFWNRRFNSNVIKKTLRHGISSYLVSDTYVCSITVSLLVIWHSIDILPEIDQFSLVSSRYSMIELR